jgi:flagellar biosynthesis/type III secretory pathway protein FliH
MMPLGEGRLVFDTGSESSGPPRQIFPRAGTGRVVSVDEMAARENISAMLVAARNQAEAILSDARTKNATWLESERLRVRGELEAELAERTLALVSREQTCLLRAEERIISMARLLAERVIGYELNQSGECWLRFAEQALAEARGARRVTLRAGSGAMVVLRERLEPLRPRLPFSLSLEEDESMGPTEMQLDTDIGQIHADLAEQLDRLASRLCQRLSE